MNQGPVLWFVNRSTEPQIYALDEFFTEEEANRLGELLRRGGEACRIEEVCRATVKRKPVSWNLLGRLFELEPADASQLGFRVVGCLPV